MEKTKVISFRFSISCLINIIRTFNKWRIIFMMKLIENKKLILQYKEDFGAWTYHLRIPNTESIGGKWGSLKVSGFIDDYEIKNLNLAPRKNEDKIISINKKIRDAIGKGAGDIVNVTLYLTIL